jgi:hypothetical protein
MKYKPRIFLIKPLLFVSIFYCFVCFAGLAVDGIAFSSPFPYNVCVCAIFLQPSPANSRVVNVKLTLSRQKRERGGDGRFMACHLKSAGESSLNVYLLRISSFHTAFFSLPYACISI